MARRFSPAMILLPLLVAVCFFLPGFTASIADSGTLNKLVLIDSKSVSFESSPELGLAERIVLIANPNTDGVKLKTGKVMDSETAYLKAVTELGRFFRTSDFGFDLENCVSEESSAEFIINSEDPSINIIVWEFVIYDADGSSLTVTLDDETGVIIKMIFRRAPSISAIKEKMELRGGNLPEPIDAELNAIALELAAMMTDYYSRQVVIANYEFIGSIGYYTAELTDGAKPPVVMYGSVRENVFTINEKPAVR